MTTTITPAPDATEPRALTGADGGRRFRIRADAFYVRHDGGVWLRNDTGSFSIRGAGAYELLEVLFQSLDGDRALDDICSELPDSARRSVLRLVETLWRNDFVREVRFEAEVPPGWMTRLYASHLMYLDHHADRSVTRMSRVRSRPVVVVGDGLALRSLVGALGEFGIARLTVLTSTAGAAGIADVTERFAALDPRLDWCTVAAGDQADLAALTDRAELAGSEHVVIAVDADRADEIADVEQKLVARGAEVGVLARAGDFVLAAPAATGRCWSCVRHAVVGTAATDPVGLPPAVVPATMAALHLVQHLFMRLADAQAPGVPPITSVEPMAPVVRTHVGRRHPACPRHPDRRPGPAALQAVTDEVVRPDLPASEDPQAVVAASDRIVAVTTAWTDPVVGPLLRVGETDADQLPLAVSSCRVADPAAPQGAPVVREVRCRAVSPREARNQVVLTALEWAASRIAKLRGGLPSGHVLAAGWTPAEAHYRAWMAAAAAVPAVDPEWRPAEAGHVLREFLVDSLAAADRAWDAAAVALLPTGAVRATVRTAGGHTATAVGLSCEHAIDGALLRALADVLPGAAALAPLAPPAPTWEAALRRLTVDRAAALDMNAMLPHLGGDAALVAVPVPGSAR